jgi:membrane carboxypeptidase/penicillin-binding protein
MVKPVPKVKQAVKDQLEDQDLKDQQDRQALMANQEVQDQQDHQAQQAMQANHLPKAPQVVQANQAYLVKMLNIVNVQEGRNWPRKLKRKKTPLFPNIFLLLIISFGKGPLFCHFYLCNE